MKYFTILKLHKQKVFSQTVAEINKTNQAGYIILFSELL